MGETIMFRRTAAASLALSLDIGTEFAKVLLFEAHGDRADVLAASKVRQRLSDMQGAHVTDIRGVTETCAQAIEAAFRQSGREAGKAVIGIAGELVKGVTTSVTSVRERPNAPLTEAELRSLIAGAQERTLERSRKELAFETGYAEIDVQLVTSAVVGVKIDGYRVTNPLGFQGRQVEVAIYTAYAPTVHLGALQSIARALDLDLLGIATEPYAVARCFGDQESGDLSSIFIDVGGGTTDIAVVRGGGLEGTRMFALGGRAFTKRIAAEQKVPFAEAEEIKLAYGAGDLDVKDEAKVRKMLAADASVWLSGVELALEEFAISERFADNALLPAKIYLCGGGSQLPELSKALEGHDWTVGLPFAKQPEVIFLRPKDVALVRDTTGTLNSVQDVTPMALAAVGADLMAAETPGGGVLRKLARGLRS